MANVLLEKYASKIKLAESVYSKTHNGAQLDSVRKITVAKCLDNVSKFMNEAFESGMGTQRSAMGDYKKFCLALTNVGLPNLIAFDLVTVSPMSSMYGNVAYIKYVKGTTKGESRPDEDGEPITNSVWQLGDVDVNYTGQAVVEPVDSFTSGTTAVAFKQGAKAVRLLDANGAQVDDAEHPATVAADGKVTQTSFKSGKTAADVKKIAYVYDNVIIPQEKLPTLKAELANIGLEAKARRIAVYYSQMAAFQAKTDYGFDLADGLAEQAVGQLSYEIDTEIIQMLYDAAQADANVAAWSRTQPVGVNYVDHLVSFAAKLEEYKMAIYNRTKKFTPNFMVCSSSIMPLLGFINGFQAANIGEVNGPFFAGTLNGLKIYVSPALGNDEFFLGVNQGAMQASAGVYAPYMPVVPTQLLGFADGGMSQGWSTMYDAKILNADLLIKGQITA